MYMYMSVLLTAVLRLTFPVREGVLLKPFQLEHGKQLSHQPFHLRESVYRMLLHRYMYMYMYVVYLVHYKSQTLKQQNTKKWVVSGGA